MYYAFNSFSLCSFSVIDLPLENTSPLGLPKLCVLLLRCPDTGIDLNLSEGFKENFSCLF